MILAYLNAAPRRAFVLVAVGCLALLAFGLYLQHVVGLDPCPMCIMQRFILFSIAIGAALAAFTQAGALQKTASAVLGIVAASGAFVAARQSWLQWYPPESASCGRDFYGMIETFPLTRAIPMIFKGSGDCTKIDWTFLGLSIANWSFLNFLIIGFVMLVLLGRRARR